jgi:hypothetical protein
VELCIVAIDAESEGDYLLASGMLLDLIEQCNEEVGYTEVIFSAEYFVIVSIGITSNSEQYMGTRASQVP